MFRVNALFEAWLREATEKPLASWKRAALLWRLQEDEELRCYAAELAQFAHEPEPEKGLSPAQAQWMRERLQARLQETGRGTLDDASAAWWGPAIGLAIGALVLGVVLNAPDKKGESVQGGKVELGGDLTLPSPTPTATPSPTPNI